MKRLTEDEYPPLTPKNAMAYARQNRRSLNAVISAVNDLMGEVAALKATAKIKSEQKAPRKKKA